MQKLGDKGVIPTVERGRPRIGEVKPCVQKPQFCPVSAAALEALCQLLDCKQYSFHLLLGRITTFKLSLPLPPWEWASRVLFSGRRR